MAAGAIQALTRHGEPVDASRGALVESASDLSVASRGPGLQVGRTYDSVAATEGESGVFGVGWSSLLDSSLSVSTSGGSSKAVWREPSGAKVSFSDDGSGWLPVLSSVTAELSASGGQYRVATGDGTSYVFEPGTSGVLRLVQVVDRDGYVLGLGWSASQVQLTSRVAPGESAVVARSINVGLSGGRVVRVRDAAGRQVRYTFSGDDLVGVTSLGGGSWSYSYDSSGHLTNMVDPAGDQTVNQFDSIGRVIAQWDPNAVTTAGGSALDPTAATQFSYEGFANGSLSGVTTITLPDGTVGKQTFSGSSELSGAR